MMEKDVLDQIKYKIGNKNTILSIKQVKVKHPFDDRVCDFLNSVSSFLMSDKLAKKYPDVITYAFWIRKASILSMKGEFHNSEKGIRLGRGLVFHISPSNVPVNFAYSMTIALLMGNSNIVRLPSKDYVQVDIICNAIKTILSTGEYDDISSYLALISYGHERHFNDYFSSICDIRVIWGGDSTISEIRKSELSPRSTEIVFADRYSLAVIDSDVYMETLDKKNVIRGFYNDTYLTDQNACTSPKLLVWTGKKIKEAKNDFWSNLHSIVKDNYVFHSIQAVNKLSNAYIMAASLDDIIIEETEDNLITRIEIKELDKDIIRYASNSGFFIEYECSDLKELSKVCNDVRCQTVGYIGHPEMFSVLIEAGIKGVDRIVPIGKTMDFDVIWDGFDLRERLTRIVYIRNNP